MKNKSLVSINDYDKEKYIEILDLAEEFEKNPRQKILENNVIASLFFEPSTRTRLSFESAVSRLGGKIIGFTDSASSSVKKGESLKDTIKTVANYSDLIVMRHPREGGEHDLVRRIRPFHASVEGPEEGHIPPLPRAHVGFVHRLPVANLAFVLGCDVIHEGLKRLHAFVVRKGLPLGHGPLRSPCKHDQLVEPMPDAKICAPEYPKVGVFVVLRAGGLQP